ncbi:MAG: imidazole glycerol phosphate synthase subunit HisF [Candidatus Muiribacterium halophilum]|uniref:imidazole glycerol-phosphate synthase n=1 Tax=Muiribacterium halophilum TaxID=2053465 RepID=A0A2N5ZA11_MUIH1|nr:MAG: imidazole glycerol phosphate synthase subunit HisF [Candidatus Muirbacterium halophilum]
MFHRIIPKLDIKGPNLVKGIHLEGLRVLGKPEQFAKFYYENGADEIIYNDIVASLYERNSLHDLIQKTAKNIFIPITVGGGIRTVDDIKEVLRAGADKVSLNTAVIKDPSLISEAANFFGSSTIVITIEAIKQSDGKYIAHTDCGREYTGIEVLKWAKQVEELGAGEILLTSVDKEGTGENFDLELVKSVSESVKIPVIAHGGAGKKEHILDVFNNSADAVAVCSLFHYDFIKSIKELNGYEKEGNIEFLKKGKIPSRFSACNISSLKEYLNEKKINTRFN